MTVVRIDADKLELEPVGSWMPEVGVDDVMLPEETDTELDSELLVERKFEVKVETLDVNDLV